jgi:predicted dehydrogenase
MMQERLKVGVVGCGQIAQIAHIPFLQALPQFEVGALCDLSPAVVEALGEKYRVDNRYVDFQEMVRQEVQSLRTRDNSPTAQIAQKS